MSPVPATSDSTSPAPAASAADGSPTAPPAGAAFDYQLGGPYDPPGGATTVVRDRTAPPAGRGYDVCYVNGFQTQPGESSRWLEERPDLVLRDRDGEPLADPGWPDEYLLDTSTAGKRERIADVVGPWIEGCARDGYDAVEVDNLDSHLRSEGALTAEDNEALAALLVEAAHRSGLAIAQKNAVEQSARLRALGFDFAITESCRAFDECDAAADAYPVVLDVEYTDELGRDGFTSACEGSGPAVPTILRDPELLLAGRSGHVYESCPASG
ncbi:endo alpha-1,4 polygalactosaminidase [Rothia sp. AR01]|uniref:Endo alpha-1,4 polygalactosaminidase n=1 Tax=Rothia santali TaxID=2949643 RepID=A0A9X2KJP8_9MICC|nr:endo alpha-1,4 polygalactosaminidase [Rothia santali]MCP3427104.1 endo alpha-1,4 polygalactosaminidase [Rothia santali]